MRKIFLILIFTFLFLTTEVVKADCSYGNPSPDMYVNGTWRTADVKHLTTTADSCYGRNTSVLFSTGSYLPMGMFYIHAYLYEDDPPAYEPDELVKKYKGYNPNGYSLITWEVEQVVTPGKIDSTGDQNCELYMKFSIENLGGTPFTILPQDLFKYTICIS